MPKIVAYVHAYVPEHNAGAETTLHDILKNLVLAGWEATVVLKPEGYNIVQNTVPDLKDNYFVDGVEVIHSSTPKTLISYVATADVTISHLECSERTHLLSKKWGKPSIHLVHNTHPMTLQWMASSSALIINTDWIANEKAFMEWNATKMVLNPPVDPREYETSRGKCITLVNLWENKGAAVFYELARRNPELQFLGVKGGYGEQVIEELPNVTIMDHTDDMKEVYSKTKIILMPSKYESFGRVGVEAMASGIPVIAEPTPGLQESLGDAGTFASITDMDSWSSALRDALKPAKYGKLSKLAKARSEELAKKRKIQLDTMQMFMTEIVRVGAL